MKGRSSLLWVALGIGLAACGGSGGEADEELGPEGAGGGGVATGGGGAATGGGAGAGAATPDSGSGGAVVDASADGGRFANDPPFLTAYYPANLVGAATSVSPDQMTFDGLTHIVHFAAGPTQTAPYITFDEVESGGQQAPLLAGAHEAGAKVVLSVGGVYGAGSDAIEYAMADPARAQTFATTALTYARGKGYDGIEIDYEPVWNRAAATKLATMDAIAKIIADGPGGNDGVKSWQPPGTLILAVGGNRAMYSAETIARVDQMNMMLYDMANVASGYCNPGDGCEQDVTGFNAPLHRAGLEYPLLNKYSSSYDQSELPKWVAGGVDPRKLGAGIPIYAYIYPGKSVPGESAKGVVPGLVRYDTVLDGFTNGGKRQWDATAMVPWVTASVATGAFSDWNFSVAPGQSFYITYDDPESLAAKVDWARRLGIGGVMVFDIGSGWSLAPPAGQAPDALIRAVVAAMK